MCVPDRQISSSTFAEWWINPLFSVLWEGELDNPRKVKNVDLGTKLSPFQQDVGFLLPLFARGFARGIVTSQASRRRMVARGSGPSPPQDVPASRSAAAAPQHLSQCKPKRSIECKESRFDPGATKPRPRETLRTPHICRMSVDCFDLH